MHMLLTFTVFTESLLEVCRWTYPSCHVLSHKHVFTQFICFFLNCPAGMNKVFWIFLCFGKFKWLNMDYIYIMYCFKKWLMCVTVDSLVSNHPSPCQTRFPEIDLDSPQHQRMAADCRAKWQACWVSEIQKSWKRSAQSAVAVFLWLKLPYSWWNCVFVSCVCCKREGTSILTGFQIN